MSASWNRVVMAARALTGRDEAAALATLAVRAALAALEAAKRSAGTENEVSSELSSRMVAWKGHSPE